MQLACTDGTHTKKVMVFVTRLLLSEHFISCNEFKCAMLPFVYKQCSMHGWRTHKNMVMVFVTMLLLSEHFINCNEFKCVMLPFVNKQCSKHGWRTHKSGDGVCNYALTFPM